MAIPCRYLIVAALITVSPRAHAQADALAALLSRVTAINAYGTFALLRPKSAEVSTTRPGADQGRSGLKGYGVEFLFRAKTFRSESSGPVAEDTTLTLATVARAPRGADTMTTYTMNATVEKKPAGVEVGILEVALGYSQVTGFYSTDPTVDLRGSIRELPSLAFYYSFPQMPAAPYVGLRSGLIQLHQTRIHDTTTAGGTSTVFPVDAQSFQAGPVLGFVHGWSDVNLFIEGAYMHRTFPSLSITGKDGAVPSRFPRSLNFSGFYFQAGVQVEIGAAKK